MADLIPRVHWMQDANQKGNLLRPVGMRSNERISLFPDQLSDKLKPVSGSFHKTKFMPRVIILFGRRGQGKTLWQTTILAILKNRHLKAKSGYKIMTNYHVEFADYVSPYLLDKMHSFPPWAQNAVIALDEIAELLPSTRAMSTYNLLSGTFLRQIRKRNCEVLGATQFPQEISRPVLRQTDFFVECELVDNGKGVKTYWWDWWGQITGRYDHKYFPPMKGSHDYSFTLYGTDRMFGQYRTEEVIANVYMGEASRQRIVNQQYDFADSNDSVVIDPSESMDDDTSQSIGTFDEVLDMVGVGDKLYLMEVLDLAKEQYPDTIRSLPTLRRHFQELGYLLGKDHQKKDFAIKQ